MDRDSIEILTQDLKKTFMDGVERIQNYDMMDFKEVIDLVAKNVSLSLYHDEDVDSVVSEISIGVLNICGQFGSSDSTDMDFFIVLPEEKSPAFMNAVREYYKIWFKGMIKARGMEYTGADIQFITVNSSGNVDWAEKGNETEINNAIFNTYPYHYLNMSHREGKFRECPIKSELEDEIGIKALKTVRSLLTFVSRTRHRDNSKNLLFKDDLSSRVEYILSEYQNDGFLSDIKDFNKPNISNEDILKSITFSFIQLHAMINNLKVPYTKHQAIWNEKIEGNIYKPEYHLLAPFLLRYTEKSKIATYDDCIKALDCLIKNTLESLLGMISYEKNGIIHVNGDKHHYHVRKEVKSN